MGPSHMMRHEGWMASGVRGITIHIMSSLCVLVRVVCLVRVTFTHTHTRARAVYFVFIHTLLVPGGQFVPVLTTKRSGLAPILCAWGQTSVVLSTETAVDTNKSEIVAAYVDPLPFVNSGVLANSPLCCA